MRLVFFLAAGYKNMFKKDQETVLKKLFSGDVIFFWVKQLT